jgi:hypothetical protein
MQFEIWQPAEKLDVAFDFGWRSGSPLRSVARFSGPALAAEARRCRGKHFFRSLLALGWRTP